MKNNTSELVNTIIMLASPLDKPVLNIDFYFEAFYRNINSYWLANRLTNPPITNATYNCCNATSAANSIELGDNIDSDQLDNDKHLEYLSLQNQLIVTIGGGSRDNLVHSGLTTSQFSDVHAMVLAFIIYIFKNKKY